MLQKSRVSLSSDYLRFDLDDPFVSDFPSQNSLSIIVVSTVTLYPLSLTPKPINLFDT